MTLHYAMTTMRIKREKMQRDLEAFRAAAAKANKALDEAIKAAKRK
jgi:hypothetical protein